jgi:hypothetical protein
MPTAFHRFACCAALAVFALANGVFGQSAAPPASNPKPADLTATSSFSDQDCTPLDSSASFIDSAIPWTQLRIRYDSAYDFRRPNRAEYFFAKPRPTGPGPIPETRIHYQEPSLYGEVCITDRWSVFGEAPMRILNPDVNPNYYGISDITVGGKYAFIMKENWIASLQLRVTSPTGDADRGLGTRHVSIEPGLLSWLKLNERWGVESEVRYWAPVGGTDFAGDMMRYGVGIYHNLYLGDTLRLTPVAEVVGWSVFGGKEQFLLPSGASVIQEAVGATIVNAMIGLRVGVGADSDMYIGYGHALTGDKWYRDVFRFELRRRF